MLLSKRRIIKKGKTVRGYCSEASQPAPAMAPALEHEPAVPEAEVPLPQSSVTVQGAMGAFLAEIDFVVSAFAFSLLSTANAVAESAIIQNDAKRIFFIMKFLKFGELTKMREQEVQ
jgi:hypothetical protein